MPRRIIPSCRLLSAVICILAVGLPAWASPSGLNNIPTTDVVPPKTFVLQAYTNMGDDFHTQHYLAFKTGVIKGVEVGTDWKAHDRAHGHAAFQGKYAFDIKEGLLRAVVGTANLSCNRADQGELFPYAATSLDLKVFRLHAGFAPEAHNEAFFAGIDRTFPFLGRNLQLKADAIQFDDKDEVLFSAGFLYEFGRKRADDEEPPSGLLGIMDAITRNLILESWVSVPTGSGNRDTYTIKLNYVISW